MPDSETFWTRKKTSLDRTWKAFRRETAGSAPELAQALEGIATIARAARDADLARRAERMGRPLSRLARLEKNRELLARARTLGFLSPESAAALDARWEERLRDRRRRALRRTRGRPKRRLRRALARCSKAREDRLARRLEAAHRHTGERVEPPARDAGRRDLSRYRTAIRSGRELALATAEAAGLRAPAVSTTESLVTEGLDRWHGLSAFRRLLFREREEAERRGAVTLALELDPLLSALERTIEKARRDAIAAARAPANVVSFRRRTA